MAIRTMAIMKMVLSFIILILWTMRSYGNNINSSKNSANYEVSNDERVHNDDICLSNATLPTRENIAADEPTRNTCIPIGPMPVGIKNPITVEATRIFEISAKYFASNSI